MCVREATEHDIESIADVIVKTWKSSYRGLINDDYLDNMKPARHIAIFSSEIQKGETDFFVYEENNSTISGVCIGCPLKNEKWECELRAIYVLDEYQGKGIGKALITEFARKQRMRGLKSMILWTLENNPSKGFYKKLGGEEQLEKKEIEIGSVKYSIVAFVWNDVSIL